MAQLELKKAHRQDESELAPKVLADYPDSDFIPFVSHYDKNTILTKNGELMQVIRITGFNHESITSELINLRETIRDSIKNNIKSNNFALWLHTIRRKKNIAPKGEFNDDFSKQLNQLWEKENNWQDQFVNELYLTVIIEGYDTSIINFNSLMRSFSASSTARLHEKALEKSHKILSETTAKLLTALNDYGAKMLGIISWEGVLYSEPMRFFGKIINLCEDRYPLSFNDISEDLANYKIAFGNNSLQIINEEKKHFASMFSIKEYSEVGVEVLDKFLQMPQEFIITQSVDFINRNQALSTFNYQHYILDISGDDQMKYLSGIDSIVESDTGSPTDYGEQQITIMLINETTKGLQKDIDNALEKLYELGLVTVREDIFSEHCFWSQLPGNFTFLRRQKPINTSRLAGFASLHNFPAGNREGNHWGDAVTIFRTVLGTPYFFNFHYGDNGHTLIVGPFGSGKTMLLNFLVCQSLKFKNKLFYFGYNRSGNIFINSINGNYWSVTQNLENPHALKLNPLLLPKNEQNKIFLINWFKYLVSYGADPIAKEELALLPTIVEKIINSGFIKLSAAAELFNTEQTKTIHKKLSAWHSSGKFAFVFDHESENIWADNLVNAFNLTPILNYKHIVIPIMSYLLHKIESLLDGAKTMIVLDEAWKLIDNYAIGPSINDLLIRLEKKNCMVIFATESVAKAAESSITKAINKNIATHFFLPDSEPSDYYKMVFGLSDYEFNLLPAMSTEERHFLLKHGNDSIIAGLDLSNIPEAITVLSSRPETLVAMEEVIKEYGVGSQNWLPKFFEIVKQL